MILILFEAISFMLLMSGTFACTTQLRWICNPVSKNDANCFRATFPASEFSNSCLEGKVFFVLPLEYGE